MFVSPRVTLFQAPTRNTEPRQFLETYTGPIDIFEESHFSKPSSLRGGAADVAIQRASDADGLLRSARNDDHLAYELDKKAFGGRYEIHAQQFIQNARPLSEMNSFEIDAISQKEWEKLNFRLISGNTDADMGNVLYSKGKLYLINTSNDFAGRTEQREYHNPWAAHPKSEQRLSLSECDFLHKIDIQKTMEVFEQTESSRDQYLTQITRLYLAKLVGKYRLTQTEWFAIMAPKKGLNGKIYPGQLESIYGKHAHNWIKIHDELELAVCEQIKTRKKKGYEAHPAFHV